VLAGNEIIIWTHPLLTVPGTLRAPAAGRVTAPDRLRVRCAVLGEDFVPTGARTRPQPSFPGLATRVTEANGAEHSALSRLPGGLRKQLLYEECEAESRECDAGEALGPLAEPHAEPSS
jgi:hypothetical protein